MTTRTIRKRAGWIGISVVFGILTIWFFGFSSDSKKELLPPIMTGNRPRVTLRQGTVVGIEADRSHGSFPQILEHFLGVPYGLPTGGVRRFKPPSPVLSSDEEIDARKWGARCPAGGDDGSPQSEDCLNLNVFRPKIRDESQKLPVLVYLHGGAFNSGSGSARQISMLVAWSSKPMIGVSLNYRVGAFGFLPSSLTAKEGLLNVGLKDQALALQWVKDNIAEFGGDPNDVTIMGSSAGAHSVGHHLMANPDEPPLFHKAIIESGATTARAVYPYDNPLHEKQFQEFLAELGLKDTPEDKIIYTLRTLPTSQIKHASEAVFQRYDPSVRWPFQPVIDGSGGIIPIAPIKAWQSGKWHKVPILTGYNTNEGAMFVPSKLSTSAQFTAFFHTLLPGLSEDDLKALNEVYLDPIENPSSKYVETRAGMGLGVQFKRVEQAYAHFAYIAPVRHTAYFASQGPAPVYLYHFAVNSSIAGGADHGDHMRFVTYNQEIRDVSQTVEEISGKMHAYWTSFITTGDPNEVKGMWKDRPTWPVYQREEGQLVVFGEGNEEIAGRKKNKGIAVQVKDDDEVTEECEFWWKRTELFEI